MLSPQTAFRNSNQSSSSSRCPSSSSSSMIMANLRHTSSSHNLLNCLVNANNRIQSLLIQLLFSFVYDLLLSMNGNKWNMYLRQSVSVPTPIYRRHSKYESNSTDRPLCVPSICRPYGWNAFVFRHEFVLSESRAHTPSIYTCNRFVFVCAHRASCTRKIDKNSNKRKCFKKSNNSYL